jgi:hypothetical protein
MVDEGPAICVRCVLDAGVPGIRFDGDGICNYCTMHDAMDRRYALSPENRVRFEELLARIKASGKDKRYDCVVGLSGGRDSTYTLLQTTRLGLRPLAVLFDNGWLSPIAKSNVERATRKLGVDFKAYGWNWDDLKKMYIAFLRSSIPAVCGPCFVGIGSALFRAALENDVRYVILGTSFRTEGIVPLEWNYVDGRSHGSIVRRFGGVSDEGFCRLRLRDLLGSMVLRRIRTIQLPLYTQHVESEIDEVLKEELDWVDGGGHHFDCLYKPLATHVRMGKFDVNPAKIRLAALVRSGHVTREDALDRIRSIEARGSDVAGIAYCLRHLGLTDGDLDDIMAAEARPFTDYPSYYSLIRALRIPLRLLCRLRLVPETAYEKFFPS